MDSASALDLGAGSVFSSEALSFAYATRNIVQTTTGPSYPEPNLEPNLEPKPGFLKGPIQVVVAVHFNSIDALTICNLCKPFVYN